MALTWRSGVNIALAVLSAKSYVAMINGK